MSSQQRSLGKQLLNTLAATLEWFRTARPETTSKSFHTQTGVHFEEVAEMVEALKGLDAATEVYLHNARVALHALGNHLKASDKVLAVGDRQLFLDALCDQIVTGTGVAHEAHFDFVSAVDEVNRSNWSKFVDGKPIFNENGKIMKGPNYSKPDLEPFLFDSK